MPENDPALPADVIDVAIVGYGPVGQALAVLLARAGHRVAAVERFRDIYRLPRAVHLDHEVMRILQALGVTGALEDDLLPLRDYHWFGADGEALMTLEPALPSLSGWEPDYLFFQPTLEAALDARARALPAFSLHRGWVAEELEERGDHAALTLRRADEPHAGALEPTAERRELRARWVIGADGANSFVRESSGITRRDLGFREQWFVVDLEPHDIDALELPRACQWCDPARPTTHVQAGRHHRRWEFMLLPGEHAEDFDQARAWELLAPWLTPRDAVLTRHAVYEFRSMVADDLRAGRALLAGDAAHLTPPFLGQGLCAGLRDAINLAWKLDLVLRGAADDAILDTGTEERQPQNEWVINFAVVLGQGLCELDPGKAAARDAAVREGGPPPEVALVPLAGGILRDADDALAGHLTVQGRLSREQGAGLMDDLTGGGFQLIVRDGSPLAALDAEQRAFVRRIGLKVVSLDPAVPLVGALDVDGRTTAFLDEHGVHAVLVRPDFYAFGSAATAAEIPTLIDALHRRLPAPLPTSA